MDGFIDHIKDKWLEWESIAYAAGALIAIFGILTATDFLQPFSLQIALIFIGILAVYTIFCAIHVRKEKIKASGEANGKNLTCKFKVLFCSVIAISSIVIIVVTGTLLYNPANKISDGKYVIWADEYRIALTPEVHKKYYLSGEKISVRKGEPDNYPAHCVFELDFDKDETFTIKYRDKFIGVTPGQNGVGYSDSCTSIRWKLEEADEGIYYIINVDENVYLKWYDDMSNWTTHHSIIEKYHDQYLLCIEKAD